MNDHCGVREKDLRSSRKTLLLLVVVWVEGVLGRADVSLGLFALASRIFIYFLCVYENNSHNSIGTQRNNILCFT